MTLTQNGTSVTGMPAPITFDAGNGVIVSESGLISGAVEGENVMLALTDLITVSGMAGRGVHRQSHVQGHARRQHPLRNHDRRRRRSRAIRASKYLAIVLPDTSGPVIYTRQ